MWQGRRLQMAACRPKAKQVPSCNHLRTCLTCLLQALNPRHHCGANHCIRQVSFRVSAALSQCTRARSTCMGPQQSAPDAWLPHSKLRVPRLPRAALLLYCCLPAAREKIERAYIMNFHLYMGQPFPPPPGPCARATCNSCSAVLGGSSVTCNRRGT